MVFIPPSLPPFPGDRNPKREGELTAWVSCLNNYEEKPRKHLQRFSFLRNGCVSKMLKFENKFSISSSSHPKPYGRNLFRDKPRHLVPVKTLIWIWIYELQIWNWLRKRNYKLWVLNYASKKRNQLVSPLLSSTIVEQRPLVPYWGFCPPGTGEPKGV